MSFEVFFMNRFRKLSAVFLALLLTLLFAVPAAAAEKSGLDIVVLLDASGSMKSNAKIPENVDIGNRFLVPGVESIINALALQSYEVNMGVVIFSLPKNSVTIDDKLWQLTDGEMPNVDNAEELIKRVQEEYDYKTDTDQPNAVQLAIDLLEKHGSADNSKHILLITDGVNDDGTGSSAAIDAKMPGVIDEAKNKGIKISTIGFNPNDADFSKLDDYSEATGGVSVQIKTPGEIGLEIIGMILNNVRSIEIPEELEYFEIPITVEKTPDLSITGLTLIFDSTEVTNITLRPELAAPITEGNPRMEIIPSDNSIAVNVKVEDDYGKWLLTGNKPAGTKVYLYYSFVNDEPEPTTTTPPETTTETTTETSRQTTPPPETITTTTTTTTPVPVTTTTTYYPPEPPGPKVPIGLIILIVVLVAGAVALAVYIAKRPKLTGKIKLTVEGDGFGSSTEEREFDDTKPKQSLFDLFYGVADNIIADAGADEDEVVKYFKRVTFEATGSGQGIKFKTEAKVETIYPDRGLRDFSTSFTTGTSSSSSSYDDDDYKDSTVGTVGVEFSIEYTIDKKEEEEEYGEQY
jgi:hypothetical protein